MPGAGTHPPTSFHSGCGHPERGISVACHTIIGYARALPCAIACRPVGAMGCGPTQRHSIPGAGTHPPTSFHAGCGHPERRISVACHTIIGYARALPCAIACRPVGAMGCGPTQRHSMPVAPCNDVGCVASAFSAHTVRDSKFTLK